MKSVDNDMRVKCPECGYPQWCGCEACLKNFPPPEGMKTYYFTDGENIACGGCDTVRSGSEWIDVEGNLREGLRTHETH
jgi:hypothetical protein